MYDLPEESLIVHYPFSDFVHEDATCLRDHYRRYFIPEKLEKMEYLIKLFYYQVSYYIDTSTFF